VAAALFSDALWDLVEPFLPTPIGPSAEASVI
jgi:hypothetical protein